MFLLPGVERNVGTDKDIDRRQRAAIGSFAQPNGYEVVNEFYDSAVSGADPIAERPGFAAMLDRIAGNGVRTILVEGPDRFARDLAVQLAGHDHLRSLGVTLIPASRLTSSSRTRQRRCWCAKCSVPSPNSRRRPRWQSYAARQRKREAVGKVEGRKNWAELNHRSWSPQQSVYAGDHQRGTSAHYVRSPTNSRNWDLPTNAE